MTDTHMHTHSHTQTHTCTHTHTHTHTHAPPHLLDVICTTLSPTSLCLTHANTHTCKHTHTHTRACTCFGQIYISVPSSARTGSWIQIGTYNCLPELVKKVHVLGILNHVTFCWDHSHFHINILDGSILTDN